MNQRLTALVLCGFLAAPSLSFAAAASPSASKDAAPAAVVKSSPKEEVGVFQKDHVLIVNGKTLDAASLPTPVLVRQRKPWFHCVLWQKHWGILFPGIQKRHLPNWI